MSRYLRPAIAMLAMFTIITGGAYPLLVTGVAWAFFPGKAGGSLIVRNGTVAGSRLIGQHFSSRRYFWGRPSATPGGPYDARVSSGSNYGPLNPALVRTAKERAAELHSADAGDARAPVDLLTSSGSGLDPHISVAAALFQVPRVARERAISPDTLRVLIDRCTEGRGFSFLGEPGVNVLSLNLSLDSLSAEGGPR